jgi:hypothetical protein
MVRRRSLSVFALLAALFLASSPGARGEGDGPKPPPGKGAAPKDGDPKEPNPVRVYVPFEDLRKVFEKEGQGVFVPWEEFQKLWRKAMDRPESPTSVAGVTAARYEGRVEGDLAILEATLDVAASSDGESAVFVGLGDAALGEATLNGKPAILLDEPGKGRKVVVRGRGPHVLKITMVAPVQPKDGDRTVVFPSAGAPVSRLTFTVPGEGVKVTVDPNLATTRTAAGSGSTLVQAYVGAAKQVRLTWRPRPVEAAGEAAVLQAATEVVHYLTETSLETWTLNRLRVMRGAIRSFRVAVPATERVLKVEGADIRSWTDAEVEGGLREIAVVLHNDLTGDYELRLKLERPRAPGEKDAVLPRVDFRGAARDTGLVAVQVVNPVAARPTDSAGLYRVPTRELPPWMTQEWPGTPRGDTILAYRYTGGERRLALAVETVAPEVSVAERSVFDLGAGSAVLRAVLDVSVEKAGLFQVVVGVPAGWDLDSAQAADEKGIFRPVDARLEGEGDARRLVLDLGTRRLGAFPVRISLRRPLDAGAAESTVDLPVLRPEGAVRVRGLLAVAADEALDVRSGDLKGFVPADPAEIRAANLPGPIPPEEGHPVILGFRHAGEARSGVLAVIRRKPQVTAETVTVAGVEEDRLHVRHAVNFTVRYAGVDVFRVSVPKAVADRGRVEGAGIKERTRAVDPQDPQRVVHVITLQAPVRGEVLLTLDYDLPQEPLAVGAVRVLGVPSASAPGVERETGWYGVTRDPSLSVEGKAKGLTAADAREVPAFGAAGEAFLTWRYLARPHSLDLSVVKHEPVKVLQAVVNALALDTLVGGGAVSLTEARMDVQVNGLQYLRVKLPSGAEIESAEVDGQPVSPRREKEFLLLPCPQGKSRDDRFPVRLVYRAGADASGRSFSVSMEAPEIADAMVQGTAWTLWVPPDAVFFSGGGNLRPDEGTSVLGAILGGVAEVFGAQTGVGNPTARGGVLPPRVTLETSGRRPWSFHRTGEDARLEARFLPRLLVGGGAAVLGVLALALAWVLARRGVSPFATAFAIAALSLLAFPSAAPGLRPTLVALLAAAGAVAFVGAVAAAFRTRRESWKAYPDPAAATPPAPPAPPPAPPAAPAGEGPKS